MPLGDPQQATVAMEMWALGITPLRVWWRVRAAVLAARPDRRARSDVTVCRLRRRGQTGCEKPRRDDEICTRRNLEALWCVYCYGECDPPPRGGRRTVCRGYLVW